MIKRIRTTPRGLCAAALLLSLAACGTLGPPQSAAPAFYSLDQAPVAARHESARRGVPVAPTLIVNPPHAAVGYGSSRIAYVRTAHQLEYYAHSEWIDPPARMIAPLIVAALETGGNFSAVIQAPSVAAGDLRLETEIIRLQHDLLIQPSQVRLTLRAYLIDNTTRSVIAWREFDERQAVSSAGPYGAVIAANQAVHNVLGELAGFCSEAAGSWKPVQ